MTLIGPAADAYISAMKHAVLTAFLLAATPLAGQEAAPEGDIDRGAELLNEGARLLFRGLLDEVEPKLQDLAELLDAWDWEGLSIDDLSKYHAPELLPNGDIIIRRKTPLPPEGAGPEIEL